MCIRDRSNEVAKVEEGEGGPPAKKKMAGKTLILFIVLPAILLLGGGGAAAYFFIFAKKPAAEASAEGHGKEEKAGEHGKEEKEGGHGKKEEKKEAGGHGKKEEKGEHGGGGGGDEKSAIKTEEGPNGEIYITLPDIVENITTADNRPIYLKLRLSLQVKNQEVADAIMPAMPRIKDPVSYTHLDVYKRQGYGQCHRHRQLRQKFCYFVYLQREFLTLLNHHLKIWLVM